MKKTLITFLALTGVAAAEGLTLNITELKSGNNMLTWTDEDVSELTSWELVFTLDSQRDALSDQDLMFFPDQARNVKFAVNANGSLEFYGSSIFTASGATEATGSVSSAAGMVKSSWRYEGDEWIWEFTVPDGTTAQVFVPGEGEFKIYSSGHHVIKQKQSR
mgnify:CR=1 FL=1